MLRRLICPLVIGVSFFAAALAQTQGQPGSTTGAVIDFKKLLPTLEHEPEEQDAEAGPLPVPDGGPPNGFIAPNSESAISPIKGPAPPAPTLTSFQALVDNGTTIPPDTMGAVGPNHVMTILNSQVLIQNRSGGTISTVSLSSFWSAVGSSPFDPHVIYDPFNGRWIVSACGSAQSAASTILVGVSQTNDPTGLWTLTSVRADAAGTNWADYPTIGFNKDWVVVTVNLFSVSSSSFGGSKIFVFRKSDLYTAAGTYRFTLITDPNGTFAPADTYDNTLGTLYLVQAYTGNSGGNGFIRINTISGAVGSEALNAIAPYPIFVSTPNPWDSSGIANGFAPQLGSVAKISTNDARITAVMYRNSHLWFAHTIFLPAGAATRSSVQWWQVTPGGTIVQRARIDDPLGATFYAYPSVAVNKNSDLVIGYTRFSLTQFASSDYSFRYGTDSVNTLQSDLVLKAGESVYFKTYGGSANRWGDYSSSVVDPLNDTDLWTIQEYAASPINTWATWWGKLSVGTAVNAVSVTPNSGGGAGPQTFGGVYSDTSGASDLQIVYLDIGVTASAVNSCIAVYVQGTNSLYLYNDANTVMLGPITPGGAGTQSNSQCTLTGAGGAVTSSGTNLTVPFSLTFKAGFTGVKNIYGYAASYGGANSGYQLLGTWTPPAAATAVAIASSPSSLAFTVTGTGCQPGSYTTPMTLNWTPATSCVVGFATPQNGVAGTRYAFTTWTDGGITANPRTITAPASAATYTATFKTQYQLTTTASPAGTGTITGAGFYDSGTSAPVVATANSGYQFQNWTGPVASVNSASTTVSMSGPKTVTANFSTNTTSSSSLVFIPITPCRVVDTRASQSFPSPFGAPSLVGGGFTSSGGPTRTFQIPASTKCSVPANAAAYSFNVTVIPPGQLGFLVIWPTGQPRPNAVTVDDVQGEILNSAAIVPAGTNGSVDVFASQNTDLAIDINGYFVPAPAAGSLVFVPITPCRVVDTRASQNFASPFGAPSLVGGGFTTSGGPTRTFPIRASTRCSIPANATAYSFNATVIPPGPVGFLVLWPTGQPRPNAVTVDDVQAQILNNAAIVPAGTNGAVDVFASQNTDLAIDINGYFVPVASAPSNSLVFVAMTPCRVVDTRSSQNFPSPFGAPSLVGGGFTTSGGPTRTFPILSSASCSIPSNAKAYSFNVTVIPPGSLGFLVLWPTGQPRPNAVTVDDERGLILNNAALVPAGTNGSVDVFASQDTDFVIDVNGYFIPGP